jgi:hypothetical protein
VGIIEQRQREKKKHNRDQNERKKKEIPRTRPGECPPKKRTKKSGMKKAQNKIARPCRADTRSPKKRRKKNGIFVTLLTGTASKQSP